MNEEETQEQTTEELTARTVIAQQGVIAEMLERVLALANLGDTLSDATVQLKRNDERIEETATAAYRVATIAIAIAFAALLLAGWMGWSIFLSTKGVP